MKKMPKIIQGNVYYDEACDYSDVEEIGGYLYCYSAKVSLPELTTVGGYLYCWSAKVSLPKLKH